MAEASGSKRKPNTKGGGARDRGSVRSASTTSRDRFDNFLERYGNSIFIAAAILFFLAMLALKLSFYYFEGLASVALLVFGAVFLWKYNDAVFPLRFTFSENSIWIWVSLYAFLGLLFDSAGNFIYNKPLELFCPIASKLSRDVVTIETSDGTELVQAFACVSRIGNETVEIAWYIVDAVRIVEYILLGLVLIGAYRAIMYWKHAK